MLILLTAWIHSVQRGEEDDIVDPNARLLPSLPAAQYPHRNHMPIPKPRVQIVDPHRPGRADRSIQALEEDTLRRSRWHTYARASAFPRHHSEIVTEEWKAQNLGDLDAPWAPGLIDQNEITDTRIWLLSRQKRTATMKRSHVSYHSPRSIPPGRPRLIPYFQRILMRNPFVPLLVRLTVMTFCAAALAVGAWIYHTSAAVNNSPAYTSGVTITPGTNTSSYICKQQASTYLAFIVDSFAVLYLFYITWDEYFSAPLGLRSTHAKLRLLFLDLLFIVFSAANLSLAFNTLADQQWACFTGNGVSSANNNNVMAATSTCVYNEALCQRQRALCGILLVATTAWVATFTISVLRVVEKISA